MTDEWVIELHQISFNRWTVVGPAWVDLEHVKEAITYKTHEMRPTTLDKCLEAMIFWCNYHENTSSPGTPHEFKYSERLRARNINTGELIPVEALGL